MVEMHTDGLRPGGTPRRAFACPDGGGHVTTSEAIAELRKLADRARRLPPPNHRNPHAFHEARDELGHAIDRVVDQLASHLRTRRP